LKLDTLVMIQTKFGFHWSSTFRGPIFYLKIQASNYKIPLHKVNIWKDRCLENNFHKK
jgi:hypothetical protein